MLQSMFGVSERRACKARGPTPIKPNAWTRPAVSDAEADLREWAARVC